jgi:V/A-type H+-transporting ATPase subunit F
MIAPAPPSPVATTGPPRPARSLRLAMAVRPGDAGGFRLAGAEVREVAPGEEPAAFRELLGDPHLGVLAVEEELLAAAPPRLLARARERGLPVVLPFALPRRWGEPGRGQSWVAELIRRAVGYGVRLGAGGGPGAGR